MKVNKTPLLLTCCVLAMLSFLSNCDSADPVEEIPEEEIVAPILSKVLFSAPTRSQVTITASVISDGGADITARGFCWSTTPNPTIESANKITVEPGVGEFTDTLSNLSIDTVYYVKAYAINEIGIAYGAENTITLLPDLPTVKTLPLLYIGEIKAEGGGQVMTTGGSEIIEQGVVWHTDPDPTIDHQHAADSLTTDSFYVEISNLTKLTTYHVRAYAKNKAGIAYGEDIAFTTTDVLPTIQTSAIEVIGATLVKGSHPVSGGNLIAHGICISTKRNPSVETATTFAGEIIRNSSFEVFMTGLQPFTTYYARPYATNENGTAYGEEITFTTHEGLQSIQGDWKLSGLIIDRWCEEIRFGVYRTETHAILTNDTLNYRHLNINEGDTIKNINDQYLYSIELTIDNTTITGNVQKQNLSTWATTSAAFTATIQSGFFDLRPGAGKVYEHAIQFSPELETDFFFGQTVYFNLDGTDEFKFGDDIRHVPMFNCGHVFFEYKFARP